MQKYHKSSGVADITCKTCTSQAESSRQLSSATPSTPSSTPSSNDDALHKCSSCLMDLPSSSFKRNQLNNKGPGKQRCIPCVSLALSSEESAASAARERKEEKEGGKKGGKGDTLREACKEVAKEAELVTGLKPMVLGRGGGKWRRGGGGRGRGRGGRGRGGGGR